MEIITNNKKTIGIAAGIAAAAAGYISSSELESNPFRIYLLVKNALVT